MRINKFLAQHTALSRRAADSAIEAGRVTINGAAAQTGQDVGNDDIIAIDGQPVDARQTRHVTVLLNKPVGYVCSRNGQGAPTVYELLPSQYAALNPVGRLDKDSSGLLLLTDNGQLAFELTHPSFEKEKMYQIALDKPLRADDAAHISTGVLLDDGNSLLMLAPIGESGREWEVRMHEGRNRQIRRTFAALGYTVTRLHRLMFGPYKLNHRLKSGEYEILEEA